MKGSGHRRKKSGPGDPGGGSAASSTSSSANSTSTEEDTSPKTSRRPAKATECHTTRVPPLKTVLQNFLNHVETLENETSETSTYEKEFQQLKAFSDSLRGQPDFLCSEGELEVNRKKNRYKDILPFDASRVVLSEYPGVPGSDYINANYIKGASGSNAYIASQGPLPHTVNDFWRMVVETEVQVIVMACNETEAGKHKCERYWDDGSESEDERKGKSGTGEREEKQFGKFFVKVLKMREICPDFSVRTMRLRWTDKKEEERTVCQFHYSAWPDHGIPTQVKPLLEMVRLIRDCQASETLPVLIHCSAGCGRTGTICAIDFIWGLLRTGKLRSDFSLFELVKDMRRQRIAMVQTVDQYILVHRAVKELFLEQLRVIDSHPYENVDGDGHPLARNPDEITPDYETIFVKNNEQDFDRILNQRLSISSQPKTVMGTAMLKSRGDDSPQPSRTPPNPPPKQRNAVVDPSAIDTCKKIEYPKEDDHPKSKTDVEDPDRSKDRHSLFEPAKAPNNSKDAAAQRFKKGNLRLSKADNGGWRLEEVDEKSSRKSSDGKKKKSPKGESYSDGNKSELLRKPSIKKIRAFFNKEKDPAKVGNSTSDSSEDSPQSDSEIASALSKLPKFESSSEIKSAINSKSMPGSLDRKAARDPEYVNVNNNIKGKSKDISPPWPRRGKEASPTKPLATSQSSERLILQGEDRPRLPIKRSKSMKSVSKASPDETLVYQSLPSDQDQYHPSSKSSHQHHHRQGSLDNQHSDYANVRVSDYIDAPRKFEDIGYLKAKPASDYANVRLKSLGDEKAREKFLSEQLAKLHARLSKEDPTIPQDLKTSLPLIARSSDSLDHQARKMLKDCQEYLMSSFNIAEREGERLFRRPLKNRSAESSPMTTLQKSNSHLFSSHSTPSNSYNRYSNGKLDQIGSSGTGTVQKNHCSPGLNRVAEYPSESFHPVDQTPTSHYVNVKMTGNESKGRALSSQRSRERRNSFREAVEKGKEKEKLDQDGEERMSYESIWFGQEEAMKRMQSNRDEATPKKSPRSDPDSQHQRAEPQRIPLKKSMEADRLQASNYENIPPSQLMSDTGYEPINFTPGGTKFQSPMKRSSLTPPKQLQNVSSHLQSVSLVSEVLSQSTSQLPTKQQSPKQLQKSGPSNTSLNRLFSQPPPYVAPPQPQFKTSGVFDNGFDKGPGYSSNHIQPPPPQFGNPKPLNERHEPESHNAYVNVRVHRRHARETASKDDMIITSRARNAKRSKSQAVTNRMSMGDFSRLEPSLTNLLEQHQGGLTVKPANPPVVKQPTSSPPGIDLDALAQMMQINNKDNSNNLSNSSGGGGKVMFHSRSLAGVLSGAAANLKSKLSNFNSSSGDLSHSRSSPPSSTQTDGFGRMGEQPSSSIPLTVPGASKNSIVYPHRLEKKPMGPRDPPKHFQRKQEYL